MLRKCFGLFIIETEEILLLSILIWAKYVYDEHILIPSLKSRCNNDVRPSLLVPPSSSPHGWHPLAFKIHFLESCQTNILLSLYLIWGAMHYGQRPVCL